MKFLVDECLSPELTKLAHAKGHGESSHVVWLGRAGRKDWELKPFILEGDWTFVVQPAKESDGADTRSRPNPRNRRIRWRWTAYVKADRWFEDGRGASAGDLHHGGDRNSTSINAPYKRPKLHRPKHGARPEP